MSTGALYIITQDPRYVDLLLTSAASLKKAMPELPISVFSQFSVESDLFDKVFSVDATKDGFYDKARLIRDSPYERTLFIDADTYVLEPVPELFSLLDHFDCAATHEEYLNTDWHRRYPRTDIPSSFPEFNTGILMLKRSDRLNRMLDEWGALYRQYLEEKPGQPINDQPFFRVAAYFGDVRIATLTREYNCKFRRCSTQVTGREFILQAQCMSKSWWAGLPIAEPRNAWEPFPCCPSRDYKPKPEV